LSWVESLKSSFCSPGRHGCMFDAKASQLDVEIDSIIWLKPTDQDDRYAKIIQDR
jgi:hypothetical protein